MKFLKEKLNSHISRFLGVGLLAYLINVGLFNFLMITGILGHKPVTASVVSTLTSIIAAYYGNRFITFNGGDKELTERSWLKFFLVNLIALSFSALSLAFTHYVLGIRSLFIDNISANVVGIALGTIFRYYAYNKFIFKTKVN